jgi:hypothetical protein
VVLWPFHAVCKHNPIGVDAATCNSLEKIGARGVVGGDSHGMLLSICFSKLIQTSKIVDVISSASLNEQKTKPASGWRTSARRRGTDRAISVMPRLAMRSFLKSRGASP